MDDRKYATLVEALAAVPDPRRWSGQRYPWVLLLTLVSAALATGQRTKRIKPTPCRGPAGGQPSTVCGHRSVAPAVVTFLVA
jgi:hypothetical protein